MSEFIPSNKRKVEGPPIGQGEGKEEMRRKVSHDKSESDDVSEFGDNMEEEDHCKSLKDLLDPPADITDEQTEKLSQNTNMTDLLNEISIPPESQGSTTSQASISSTTVTITNNPLEANITSEEQNPNFLNDDGTFNIDEYIKKLIDLSTVSVQRGGKRRNNRYKLRHKTTMKKRKIIKGGDVRGWICDHKEFVAWVMMMSCLGGGYWCLATFIIPIAIGELGTVIWNYIVKICETTAVIVTNLFKTNGGVSKFLDLLVDGYRSRALFRSGIDDINTNIIKPFFDLIVSAITWGCEKTAPGAAAPGAAAPGVPPANIDEALTEDLRKQLHDALAIIAELETRALQQIGENAEENVEIIAQIQENAVPLIQMIEKNIEPLAEENIHAIEAIYKKMEGDIKEGGNIISYLAKKIKKTMKRRKRSHKKYAKKNIHYKSHKKNKR